MSESSNTKTRKKIDTEKDERVTNAQLFQMFKEFKSNFAEILTRISQVEANVENLQMADNSDDPDSLKNSVNALEQDQKLFSQNVNDQLGQIQKWFNVLEQMHNEILKRFSQIEADVEDFKKSPAPETDPDLHGRLEKIETLIFN